MPSGGERRSFECPECHRTYAKAEHLQRHERTHTGSKPYSCWRCTRSFSRQDSLARHLKRHTHTRGAPNDAAKLASPLPGHSASPPAIRDPIDYNFQDFASATASGIPEQQDPLLQPNLLLSDNALENSVADEASYDPFFQLTWPDSEDLLQSLLSADFNTWQQPLEALPSQSILRSGQQSSRQATSPWLNQEDPEQTDHSGNQAVRNLSQMITTLSADVTSDAEFAGLTTVFLDGCLHMFFTHFVPTFPIVHRPTFVFREWTHPLLLNAIALGSRFMYQKENSLTGEALWRLAHTAVATSWHTLIKHRGPFDTCCGMQLVLTALFGQVYAIFSTNVTLRKTAQIFHSLGFYWARECGMYGDEEVQELFYGPELTKEMAREKWRKWAAQETQLRALLGHYVLDSQIAHYTGGPTCQRHASNPLRIPCDDSVFEAPTAEEWISRLRAAPVRSTTFADLFTMLFSPDFNDQHLSSRLHSLTASVLLEGLKSLVMEHDEIEGHIVGVPDKQETLQALSRMHHCIVANQQMSSTDRCNTLLRWHTICLDAATDSVALCRQMCLEFSIEQKVFGGKNHRRQTIVNLREWVSTLEARQALLHAISIWDILQDLPLGRAHAIHVPACVFASAMVYCAYCIAGVPVIQTPVVRNWQSVLAIDPGSSGTTGPAEVPAEVQLRNYLTQQHDVFRLAGTPTRNLLYDLNSLPFYLKNLSKPWGVAATMAEILEQLVTFCST